LLIHTDLQSVVVDPDFDGNGLLECGDIDDLVAAIVSAKDPAEFDLTGDGLVNLADRDQWLAEAGAVNLDSGGPYLLGDMDLDGFVDGDDFMIWNVNKFTTISAWCSGDVNADGLVDGHDLLLWNENKFQVANNHPSMGPGFDESGPSRLINLAGVATVPEPSGLLMLGLAMCAVVAARRST
jgi:hypothetical protein